MYYNRQVVISIKIKATNKMSSYDYKFMNYRHIEKSNDNKIVHIYCFKTNNWNLSQKSRENEQCYVKSNYAHSFLVGASLTSILKHYLIVSNYIVLILRITIKLL